MEEVERELNSVGFQDDATWARLLTIVCDLLEHTRRSELRHAGLQGLLDTTIWPGIRSEHTLVQTLAMRALALYALLDRATATKALPMFLAAAEGADTLSGQATAMRAVTDLLMMFEDILTPAPTPAPKIAAAPAAQQDNEEEEKKEQLAADVDADAAEAAVEAEEVLESPLLSQVQALFYRHLMVAYDCPDGEEGVTEVCVMALECLAKLWLYDRLAVHSGSLAAVLCIFFNPRTDTRMAQCLAVFLPAFMVVNPQAHTTVYFHALLPALKLLHIVAAVPSSGIAGASAIASATGVAADDDDAKHGWKGFQLVSGGFKAMLSFLGGAPAAVRIGGYTPPQALALEIAHTLLAFPAAALALQLVQALAVLMPLTSTPAAAAAKNAKDAALQPDAPTPFLATLMHLLSSVQASLRDKVALKELSKLVEKLSKASLASGVDLEAEALDEQQVDLVEEAAAERVAQLQKEQEEEDAMHAAEAEAENDEEDEQDEDEATTKAKAKRAKKEKNAAKPAPAKGKRALRPKTPAKAKAKAKTKAKGAAARNRSDDESTSNSEEDAAAVADSSDDDQEEDEEAKGFKLKKASAVAAPKSKKPAAPAAAPVVAAAKKPAAAAAAAASRRTASPVVAAPVAAAAALSSASASASASASSRPSRASKVQAQAKMDKASASQLNVDKILDAESDSEQEDDEQEEEEEEDEEESEEEEEKA